MANTRTWSHLNMSDLSKMGCVIFIMGDSEIKLMKASFELAATHNIIPSGLGVLFEIRHCVYKRKEGIKGARVRHEIEKTDKLYRFCFVLFFQFTFSHSNLGASFSFEDLSLSLQGAPSSESNWAF